jgi:hypothetical protein
VNANASDPSSEAFLFTALKLKTTNPMAAKEPRDRQEGRRVFSLALFAFSRGDSIPFYA